MKLVISGGEQNRILFDDAINNSKNVEVILKSKDKETEDVTYILKHKTWNYDGNVDATIVDGRLILSKDKFLHKMLQRIHVTYFQIFEDEDILTEELANLLNTIHTEIKQPEVEHEAIMIVLGSMISDVIEEIKKHDLCEILEIGLVGDHDYFLRIRNENITDYKAIDILMDDHYSVLFEKKINNQYGKNWMSYSNLFFCSKFKIKLLTLEEFIRREFDKQMDAESENIVMININAKNILTREAVLHAGYAFLKKYTYVKNNTVITFDGDYKSAKVNIEGEIFYSNNLSDDQLRCILSTGTMIENGAN